MTLCPSFPCQSNTSLWCHSFTKLSPAGWGGVGVNKGSRKRESKTQNVGATASGCLQGPPRHQAAAATVPPPWFLIKENDCWDPVHKAPLCYLSDVQDWGLYIFVTLFTGQDYFLKLLGFIYCLQLKTWNLHTLFTVENVNSPPLCLQVKGRKVGEGPRRPTCDGPGPGDLEVGFQT